MDAKNTGRIYLLFTADYELYFGENYLSEREVLIEPTEQILRAFEEEGIPITLFADVASVWRYRSLGVRHDYVPLFEDQLQRAIRRGHDVQLHLHPHWLTSEFDGQRWQMDASKFKLSDIGYGKRQDPFTAEELIVQGKGYLEDLLRPVDPLYRCVAFRAGGFGVQPEDKALIGSLHSCGFKIDSSIAPGMFFKSNVNEVDFRRIPSKLNYRMGPRYGIYKEEKTGIFEIPIAAYSESFCEALFHYILLLNIFIAHLKKKICRTKNEFAPRGKAIQENSFLRQITYPLLRPLFLLELSGTHLNVNRMVTGTSKLIKRHLQESFDLYFSALCHPKNVFPPTIQAICDFWRKMVRLYGRNIEAITFQEAAKRIECLSGNKSVEGCLSSLDRTFG
jgi:hypothetical protein